MLKKYLTLLCLALSLNGTAQTYNPEINGKTQIINVDSLKAAEIQSKIMAWIALTYKSANDVIQHSSTDKIILKGNFAVTSIQPFPDLFNTIVSFPVNVIFNHTLIVAIKDNKFKIDISFPEKVKTLNYLNRDWFFNINEYTLVNEFTIKNQYQIAKTNLNVKYNGNKKKVDKNFNKLKKYLDANYAFEKEVANGMNDNIKVIFNSLSNYLNDKSEDW